MHVFHVFHTPLSRTAVRIDRLDLLAFGPFTGLSLDFSAPGLHVVYGPNEAGKSTALRAVRDALFGIPGQSPDNHTHDYKALRVGMTVSGGAAAGPDGAPATLTFRRRKGNKNTLLGLDDSEAETPLPDDGLAPFLGGTTAEAFDKLHGLRLSELSEGSEKLLAGGGEVGQLLFAAAGGLSSLRTVRDALKAEAAELFLARGRNPAINAGLRALKEVRQEAHAEGLPPQEWAARAAEIEELKRGRDALKAEAEAKRAEAARARRLRAARGLADRLAKLTEQREALEAAVAADAPLRAAAEQIARLRNAAAAVGSALEDRAGLERRAAAAEAAAARALAALAPAGSPGEGGDDGGDGWSPPDLSDPQRAHLLAAADRHAGLARDLSEAVSKRRAAAERVAELKAKLAGDAPDAAAAADALSAALDRAAAAPDPAAGDPAADRAAARLEAKIAAGLSRLTGFDGDAAALAAFPVPPSETVERAAAARQRAAAALDAARDDVARCEADADEARAALAAFSAAGAVPSQEDLSAARAARDAAWAAVRGRLEGGEPAAEPAPLIARQEETTAAADAVADSLREEAARVEEAAALAAAVAKHEARTEAARGRAERAERTLAAGDARWAEEWPGLSCPPKPPAEMRAWLATAGAVLEDHAALLDLRDRREADRAAAAEAARDLAARLAAADPDFAPAGGADADGDAVPALADLRDRAGRLLRQFTRQSGQREVFRADREKSEAVHAAAAAAEADARAGLDAWAADWARATAPLGLSVGGVSGGDGDAGGPDPAAVKAFLNGWGTVQSHRSDAAEARRRLAEIDAARDRFAADARSLAAALAPDLSGPNTAGGAAGADLDPAAAVAALSDRLDAAAERAKELREIPARVRELEADSDVQRAGEDAAAFLAAAREGDPDEQAARADTLDAEADDLDRRRDAALTAVRDAEAALAALDTRGAAAEAEQRAQGLLAELDADADRYARLALADALLAAAAERHRARHQGPVLARAGALFSRLTGGSFAGLDVSFEGGDEPALVGVRPPSVADGAEVPGEKLLPPQMSDGTRDALYLSLRLAGLAETAAGRSVPPLVVDDVLERFDDARTAAALAALAELSAPRSAGAPNGESAAAAVQVILFTHHGRVAELAAALPGGGATVHRLPTAHLPGPRPAEPPFPPTAAPAPEPPGKEPEPPPRTPRRATVTAKAKTKTTPKAAADDARQKALL